MDFRPINGIPNYVFDTETEYRFHIENAPDLKKWREAEKGDWVWSDDHRIVQILRRYNSKKGNTLVGTVVGTFSIKSSSVMDTDFSKHKSRYTISGNHWAERPKNSRLSNREKLWVAALFATGDPYAAYRKIYPAISPDYIHTKVIDLLSRDKIMDEIRESVQDSAEKTGINFIWVFEMLKELAEKSKDERVKLNAVQTAGKYIDMEPKDKAPLQLSNYGSMISDAEVEEVTGTEIKQIESNT